MLTFHPLRQIILSILTPLLVVQAQINTEKMRESAWREGWNAKVGMNLALRQGNVEKSAYNLDGILGWKHKSHLIFAKVAAEFEEASNSRVTNAGFLHIRYNLQLKTRITPEIFTQYQFDDNLRLKSRILIGAGLRMGGNISPKLFMAWGSGYVWEQEFYQQNQILTTPRWTNYQVVRWTPEPPFEIANTFYIQPAFTDFGFFRIIDEGSFRVKLSKRIILRITLNYRYDSQPIMQFNLKKSDINLSNGLEIRL